MTKTCPNCSYKPGFFDAPIRELYFCPKCAADLKPDVTTVSPRHRLFYILGAILGVASIILFHRAALMFLDLDEHHLDAPLLFWPPSTDVLLLLSLVASACALFTVAFWLRQPLSKVCRKHALSLKIARTGLPPKAPRSSLMGIALALLILAALWAFFFAMFAALVGALTLLPVVIPLIALYVLWSVFRLLSASTISSTGAHP
jgi:hypothetical protein